MSYWTYINGTITVRPMGRTQPEKRYKKSIWTVNGC